jgi:uncharacterized protein YjbJ (UPF0337 family)
MDLEDKVKNKADQASGSVKATFGKLTDDKQMEAEGRVQQAKAALVEDAEKVKTGVIDAAEHLKDRFKK